MSGHSTKLGNSSLVRHADRTDKRNEGLSPALVAKDPEKAHKVLA